MFVIIDALSARVLLCREQITRWCGLSMLTSVTTSTQMCRALSSRDWIELLWSIVSSEETTATHGKGTLPRQILALRLLKRVLPSWGEALADRTRMVDLVQKLFVLLGRSLLACSKDPTLSRPQDCNKTRRPRAPVSLSASYTSTVSEEIISLLRKLHNLDAWNAHINRYMLDRLSKVVDLLIEKPRTLTVSRRKYM